MIASRLKRTDRNSTQFLLDVIFSSSSYMQDEMVLQSLDCKWNISKFLVMADAEITAAASRRLVTKRHVKERTSAGISG